MIPELKTAINSEFLKLENLIIRNSCEIEQWFRTKWLDQEAPFYASVDLRNSGFKISPVDTNLFPAGFNNLNTQFEPLAIQAATIAIEKICPEASKIIIIPENHSRNIFYFRNLISLIEILKNAGLEVEIGNLDPSFKKTVYEIDDQEISDVLTVNGVRFSFKDGSWGLIRASSNKPSLVIVAESPTSDMRKKKIFGFIDDLLQKTGKIGEYDQKI